MRSVSVLKLHDSNFMIYSTFKNSNSALQKFFIQLDPSHHYLQDSTLTFGHPKYSVKDKQIPLKLF